MRNIQAVISLCAIILAMTLQSANALAANSDSIEFMCKSKAKEIAAQTYSGCINDNKQVELERIRKEYQSELSKIKSKYNNELKNLSGKKSKNSDKSTDRLEVNLTKNSSDMPAKKMTTSKVKSEKIDFSSDKSEIQQESPLTYQNDLGSDSSISSTEIVEIPVQEE